MLAAMAESQLRGELRYDEPLARYTTWRVGGPAQRYYRAADVDDLSGFLRQLAPQEPLLWLGLGSNTLVRDGGFRGTVIATHATAARQALYLDGGCTVWAEAGVPCAKIARFAARQGLAGAEFFAGIPGTLGGALAMNAGAWGGETWRCVQSVQTIDRHGLLRRRTSDDFRIGYRSVDGPHDEWFVAAQLVFEPGDATAAQAEIRRLLAERSRSQPTGVASGGSVFRNPPGDYAARLIDSAGLKGKRVGGAQVSVKHANFIINDGTATAEDIESLIEQVAAAVAVVHGVQLTKEVRIVGQTA